MDFDQWEKHRLKSGTVLYHLRGYAGHRVKSKTHRDPKPADIAIKTPFGKITPDPSISKYLNEFNFISGSKTNVLDEIQKQDLNLIFQKKYAILNWEQGVGKTIAGYSLCLWRNVVPIVVAPSLAIQRTWIPFLTNNGQQYKLIKSIGDFNPKEKQFYLLSGSTLSRDKRLSKGLKRLLRGCKSQLVLDESDEISNDLSNLSRNTRIAFSKCQYKLLMTGTTTRNNASELYPQLDLLFNKSSNFLDTNSTIWVWDKKANSLKATVNKYLGTPFGSQGQFNQAFSPGKKTILGIDKQKQTIYNQEALMEILRHTQITRTFKEVVGDKYKISHILLSPTPEERQLQEKILMEFQDMVYGYYRHTGNTKKESALSLIRQIQLLIKSTSVPQLFKEYKGISSTKLAKIKQLLGEKEGLVMLGTTTKDAAKLYLSALAPLGRQLFYIDGETSFKQRGKIIEDFQASTNGVLISTQQSLKSSVNIPMCSTVIVESLQWNLPKVSQYYFRAIRYDSVTPTEVIFLTYSPSIEDNLMRLMLDKEQISKALKFEDRSQEEVFEEMGIDTSILLHLIERKETEKGKFILGFS